MSNPWTVGYGDHFIQRVHERYGAEAAEQLQRSPHATASPTTSAGSSTRPASTSRPLWAHSTHSTTTQTQGARGDPPQASCQAPQELSVGKPATSRSPAPLDASVAPRAANARAGHQDHSASSTREN